MCGARARVGSPPLSPAHCCSLGVALQRAAGVAAGCADSLPQDCSPQGAPRVPIAGMWGPAGCCQGVESPWPAAPAGGPAHPGGGSGGCQDTGPRPENHGQHQWLRVWCHGDVAGALAAAARPLPQPAPRCRISPHGAAACASQLQMGRRAAETARDAQPCHASHGCVEPASLTAPVGASPAAAGRTAGCCVWSRHSRGAAVRPG